LKILVIDDEPLVRRSLLRAAKALGHECAEAADGEDGLKLWQSDPPNIVFVDVLMPGMSGPEVVRSALRIHEGGSVPKPVIALISAFSGDDSKDSPAKMASECGADLFIGKPFHDIFEVVRSVVSHAVNAQN
jgi:CheY-like chemotaxis protein